MDLTINSTASAITDKAKGLLNNMGTMMATNMRDKYSFAYALLWIIFAFQVIFIIIYYVKYGKSYATTLMTETYPQSARQQNLCNQFPYKLDNNITSICSSATEVAGYNLLDYYIKSAYNCCSIGDYKYDYVDTCILKSIIKQGVRFLDFEIFSVNDQPVVSTSTIAGHHIKESFDYIPFSDIMTIITTQAFKSGIAPNFADPIIFHFRFMSDNQKMYSNLTSLFNKYTKYFLGEEYSFNSNNTNFGATPIKKLAGKIVVIVDNSNTAFMDNIQPNGNAGFLEYVNMTSNSLFTRLYDTNSILNVQDMDEIQTFNMSNMTIVLPIKTNLKGQSVTPMTTINPSSPININSIITREFGVQVNAMCYQLTSDTNLQEYNAFFDNAGFAFALKPENLRKSIVVLPDAV